MMLCVAGAYGVAVVDLRGVRQCKSLVTLLARVRPFTRVTPFHVARQAPFIYESFITFSAWPGLDLVAVFVQNVVFETLGRQIWAVASWKFTDVSIAWPVHIDFWWSWPLSLSSYLSMAQWFGWCDAGGVLIVWRQNTSRHVPVMLNSTRIETTQEDFLKLCFSEMWWK